MFECCEVWHWEELLLGGVFEAVVESRFITEVCGNEIALDVEILIREAKMNWNEKAYTWLMKNHLGI